jgi:flavin reductase (DIM6/NTAB) family NADH-FMN oxidoreductase RutF
MPVDRDRYRQLAGSLPTGVAIVTTTDGDGAPRGLTTQSFIGLSQDPPLILVSMDMTSRTLPSLKRADGAPIFHQSAVAYAECRTIAQQEAGDWIFIAEVAGGEPPGGVPLIYFRRTDAAWPEEKPAPQVG